MTVVWWSPRLESVNNTEFSHIHILKLEGLLQFSMLSKDLGPNFFFFNYVGEHGYVIAQENHFDCLS